MFYGVIDTIDTPLTGALRGPPSRGPVWPPAPEPLRGPPSRTDSPTGHTPKVKNAFCLKLDAKSIPEALATTILMLLMFSIVLAHRCNPGASAHPAPSGTPHRHPIGTPWAPLGTHWPLGPKNSLSRVNPPNFPKPKTTPPFWLLLRGGSICRLGCLTGGGTLGLLRQANTRGYA